MDIEFMVDTRSILCTGCNGKGAESTRFFPEPQSGEKQFFIFNRVLTLKGTRRRRRQRLKLRIGGAYLWDFRGEGDWLCRA